MVKTLSLPADKPKIVFHAAMMAIQNFGFFIMYFDIWGATPMGATGTEVCDDTRFAVSFMALTCFVVSGESSLTSCHMSTCGRVRVRVGWGASDRKEAHVVWEAHA